MDIIDRFQQSLTHYNRAKSLLDKGETSEAEDLLNDALALYPREILMGGGPDLDEVLINSYETLFTDIKVQLEVIKELREEDDDYAQPAPQPHITSLEEIDDDISGPISSSSTYVSLQDIVMRNMKSGTIPDITPVERVHKESDLEIITPMKIMDDNEDVPELSILSNSGASGSSGSNETRELVAELKKHEATELDNEIEYDAASSDGEEKLEILSHESLDESQDDPTESITDTVAVVEQEHGNINDDTSDAGEGSEESTSEEILETTEETPSEEEEKIDSEGVGMTQEDKEVGGEEEIDYEALAKAAEEGSEESSGVEEVLEEEEEQLPAPKPFEDKPPQASEESSDEEALLTEEEVREDMGLETEGKKKREKKKRERKPLVLPDMSKLVGAALLIIGLAAIAGSGYFFITEFGRLTTTARIMTRAENLLASGKFGEAAQALAELKSDAGWDTDAGAFAIASISTGWGESLAAEKRIPQANQLMLGTLTGGASSQALLDALAYNAISDARAAYTSSADEIIRKLNGAAMYLSMGKLNPATTAIYQRQIGDIAYSAFSVQLMKCVDGGNAARDLDGIIALKSFEKTFTSAQRAELSGLKSQAASALEKSASGELSKKNYSEASKLAGLALELSPALRNAKKIKSIADGKLTK